MTEPWRDELLDELKYGGTEPPCPFCGLPRVKRSDYVRCPHCALNWLTGEALDKDPRTARMSKLLEDMKNTKTVKEKKE